MKYSQVAVAAAALAGQVAAFPANMFEALEKSPEMLRARESLDKRQVLGINVHFDPKTQYISNKGANEFVAPGPNDIRGPCPGLNALANHNYLPHNGVANIAQFVEATNKVFGMGIDLGGFLSIYGAIFDGDLLGWSIGGIPPTDLLAPLGTLLGGPTGLTGSHNRYESDVSPSRGDLYMTGNNYEVQMDLFKGLYALQGQETEETSNYGLDILTAWRVSRFQNSLNENPYFFNGPFSGVLVQPAAYTFIYRFMANKSEDFPEGRLSQNVLKTFFSITGDSPDEFVYTPGHESIPDNWYKRAIGDEYTIPFFLLDVVAAAETNPQFLDIGGNTGTVNSFTGVSIANLTGGLFDLSTLTQGNNLACFVFQLLIQAGPDIIQNLNSDLLDASQQLVGAVNNASTGLNCPQLRAVDQQNLANAFSPFPGVTQLQQDGTFDPNAKPSVFGSAGTLSPAIL